MKCTTGVDLSTVQAVYSGPEGDLWELIMGRQIHIGGFRSSMDLADRAGIAPGTRGIDLCCCNGGGMRLMQGPAHAGNVAQGLFVARRRWEGLCSCRRESQ